MNRATATNDLAIIQRVPPHNLDAERAVLTGSFKKRETVGILSGIVAEQDFYHPAHQIIFRACLELYKDNAPVDLLTIREKLIAWGKYEEIGGGATLAECTTAYTLAAWAEHYAKMVHDKALLRELINTSNEVINNCYQGSESVEEIIDDASRKVLKVATGKHGANFTDMSELVIECYQHIELLRENPNALKGLSTGYEPLNKLINGFQASDLIIIGARPSMGKTAFALNLILNITRQNKEAHVAFFSLEMSAKQLMLRMASIESFLPMALLNNPNEMDKNVDQHHQESLENALRNLQKRKIFIDETAGISPLQLKAKARQIKAKNERLDLIVVDYLQLMKSSKERLTRESEVAEISRELKALAKELKVPVIALSQLNRKLEERSEKRPLLSDIRESGSIEQDADIIMFLHRKDAYENIENRPAVAAVDLIVSKHRNGPVGNVKLVFHSETTRFALPPKNY